MRNRWIPWLACAGLALLGANRLAARDSAPGLLGRWQLNVKESEDPQAKFRPMGYGEGAPQGEGPAGERRPGQRRPTGEGGRPPRPGAVPPKLEAPPGLGEFIEPPKTLTITGNESELTLDDGKGTLERLQVDGVERREGPLLKAAKWEGSTLVVEKRNDAGARLTTRYSLMLGQRKLEVYARLAGQDRRAVTLRRTYDGTEPTQ